MAVYHTKTDLIMQVPQLATRLTGFSHLWDGLAFSEILNVFYSIVRPVHVKCCGKTR